MNQSKRTEAFIIKRLWYPSGVPEETFLNGIITNMKVKEKIEKACI